MKPARFRNPWPHEAHGILDILRWQLGLGYKEAPVMPEATDRPTDGTPVDFGEISTPPATGWRTLWLGHASFLLQGAGASLLVDPVFSSHCAPIPLPSLRRVVEPPCVLADLPAIDAVLLTHSHYDHLDLPTLRRLGTGTLLVVPEGHASWLTRAGFSRVVEIPWFESRELIAGITITATPAQHFTARTPWDRDRGHWCGWLVRGADCKLWHAGDSGYCEAFREIGDRYGPIDFGMIPIGAYQPRGIMRSMHLNPEEAVAAFLETNCRRAAAMHWGTFRLTDEPLGEPPLRLKAALRSYGLSENAFITGTIGQSWQITPAQGPGEL